MTTWLIVLPVSYFIFLGYYIFNIVCDIYISFYMTLIYLPCKIEQLTLKIKLTVTDTSLLYCFLDKTS